MKARIKKTDIVVDVEINDHLDEYVYQVPIGKGKFLLYKEDDLDFEDLYDWRTFRAEAAKDILCAMIPKENNIIGKDLVGYSIMITDELIKQLKEKEEK